MKQTKIPLYDNIQKKFVDAYLVEDVPLDMVAKTNAEWVHVRQQYRDRCRQQGLPYPEHSHWDWDEKAKRSVAFPMILTRFGIVCQNEIQGLMLIDSAMCFAKLPPDKGQSIVYIRYLETAPQNVELYTSPRKFIGVGRLFVRATVGFSVDIGCKGRVGLHALPQAEAFYKGIGMTELDRDPTHANLRYFEFTRQQAQLFQNYPDSSQKTS